ncbi:MULTISPECIES: lysine N(6)-hydroxylase/L-ornithine N(5)-oxygenase family protein [Streptomyces]|uniref:lysine N(6)-hydroxylase/L-ornithine N(5)-oxygenase family protein n=1 Tax=Streptomyces TaxID=1883 RepID=UPI001E42C93A|nr:MULTISPECIES: SidA/IucD/PvdA family monooxygenase [Streptomyces]UFQ18658.1 lysine N(6)-hydroxylase/L-ornithine N(5)-oxygenase family protein [Streptomyces huasconensis]WCL88274.1 SidA/IucD/PvdA family monooxygenase [Streptomyces sp. JCM 35825]
MVTSAQEIHDVVGIGFGPSNLSLAIALEEHGVNVSARPVNAAFFERQPSFGWHRNMLLPSTTMQVSFLKDLATFRNPVSRFSFVSYLHDAGRLANFVNTQTFFPTRQEFHQYLEWAAAKLAHPVSYHSNVVGIRVPREATGGPSPYVQVQVEDADTGRTRLVNARNVAVSTGLVPRMPDGVARDERVWHSSEFLTKFRQLNPDDLKRVAVVGAGQSAAEITRFLYDALPHAQVFAVLPSYGYSVADDTPFANQVFDPSAVDDYYFGTGRTREAFWQYHKNTNYSVVDDEVIRDLHRRAYEEDVRATKRLHFLNLSRVDEVKRVGNETRVSLESLLDSGAQELDVDALVFATGYEAMDPSRLLGDLDRHCLRDEQGRHRVERDYRLVTTPELAAGIYLQGGTEHTHGLTSSLLSNIAVRSGEIADSILRDRAGRAGGGAAAE